MQLEQGDWQSMGDYYYKFSFGSSGSTVCTTHTHTYVPPQFRLLTHSSAAHCSFVVTVFANYLFWAEKAGQNQALPNCTNTRTLWLAHCYVFLVQINHFIYKCRYNFTRFYAYFYLFKTKCNLRVLQLLCYECVCMCVCSVCVCAISGSFMSW